MWPKANNENTGMRERQRERADSWTQVETSTPAFLFPQLSLEQGVAERFIWEDLDGALARILKIVTAPFSAAEYLLSLSFFVAA